MTENTASHTAEMLEMTEFGTVPLTEHSSTFTISITDVIRDIGYESGSVLWEPMMVDEAGGLLGGVVPDKSSSMDATHFTDESPASNDTPVYRITVKHDHLELLGYDVGDVRERSGTDDPAQVRVFYNADGTLLLEPVTDSEGRRDLGTVAVREKAGSLTVSITPAVKAMGVTRGAITYRPDRVADEGGLPALVEGGVPPEGDHPNTYRITNQAATESGKEIYLVRMSPAGLSELGINPTDAFEAARSGTPVRLSVSYWPETGEMLFSRPETREVEVSDGLFGSESTLTFTGEHANWERRLNTSARIDDVDPDTGVRLSLKQMALGSDQYRVVVSYGRDDESGSDPTFSKEVASELSRDDARHTLIQLHDRLDPEQIVDRVEGMSGMLSLDDEDTTTDGGDDE